MSVAPASGPLRVVLVDFDWQDAELMLRLVARSEVSIRLVIVAGEDSPAIRLADLGHLPRSSDLGDLTREIFDLALISERSPRRGQAEALLSVFGTPCRSPEQFVREGGGLTTATSDASHDLEVRALALESELSGADPLAFLAGIQSGSEVPRRSASSESRTESPAAPHEWSTAPEESSPSEASSKEASNAGAALDASECAELGQAIHELVTLTGAAHAELRVGAPGPLETVVLIGDPDPMAETLASLALREGSEQVIRVVYGDGESRCSGAWPIRTPRGLALVSAGGMDPDRPWETWRDFAQSLSDRWSEPLPVPDEAPPPEPEPEGTWQLVSSFRRSLEVALEQNRAQGTSYCLHRYRFAAPSPQLEELFELLPRHLRRQDLLCRPVPHTLVILTTGSPDAFFRLNQRLLHLWEGCWRMSVDAAPDPRVNIDSVELLSDDGGLEFFATADEWLGGAPD